MESSLCFSNEASNEALHHHEPSISIQDGAKVRQGPTVPGESYSTGSESNKSGQPDNGQPPDCNDRRPYQTTNLRSLKRAGHADNSATFQLTPFTWVQEITSEKPAAGEGSLLVNGGVSSIKANNSEAYPQYLYSSRDMAHRRRKMITSTSTSTSSLLRWRELGLAQLNSTQMRSEHMTRTLRNSATNDYKDWLSYGPMSKDVMIAVWAADGSTFGVGASANSDDNNLQYNDPKNLLIGSTRSNTIRELDEHHVPRPVPRDVSSGPNSLPDTYNTADGRLFTTVTSICFDPVRPRMFTGSFDRTLKVWDTSSTRPVCVQTMTHAKRVQLVEYCPSCRYVAVAHDSRESSICLYENMQDGVEYRMKLSPKNGSVKRLVPKALRFGSSPASEHLLLMGFGESEDKIEEREREGSLLLLDAANSIQLKLTSTSHAVFDVAWHPRAVYFAAAMVPGPTTILNDRKGTKSIIRTWKPTQSPSKAFEYECEAADINEVTFHPENDNYIAASCTNGKTYLWDARRDDQVLHVFRHGRPIDAVDPNLIREHGYRRAREWQDTGVKLLSWGKEGRYLYTGSSDGLLKQWDPARATEDALVKNVATFDSGIMSGAFSPDFDKLLVGTVKGSIRILSNQMNLEYQDRAGEMNFVPSTSTDAVDDDDDFMNANIAKDLVRRGEIEIHPTFGAVQGPSYSGPMAGWARELNLHQLDPDILADQRAPEQWQQGMLTGGRPRIDAEAKQKWLREQNLTSIPKRKSESPALPSRERSQPAFRTYSPLETSTGVTQGRPPGRPRKNPLPSSLDGSSATPPIPNRAPAPAIPSPPPQIPAVEWPGCPPTYPPQHPQGPFMHYQPFYAPVPPPQMYANYSTPQIPTAYPPLYPVHYPHYPPPSAVQYPPPPPGRRQRPPRPPARPHSLTHLPQNSMGVLVLDSQSRTGTVSRGTGHRSTSG